MTNKGDLLKEHLSGRSCLNNNNNKGRRKEPRKTVRVLVKSSLGVAHRARRASERLRGKAKVSLSYFCVNQEGVYLPGLDDFPCLSWVQAALPANEYSEQLRRGTQEKRNQGVWTTFCQAPG